MERNKEKKIGADIVVKALEDQGVTHVFGIPGAKIDSVFNSLVSSNIKTVVCRHEQNAAFIAGGIGRLTGRAGVCIATSGPGVSNLTTGLLTANTEADPVVALGGAVSLADSDKQIHQSMDAISILKPATKYAVRVGSTKQIYEVMGNAFRAAENGRPGSAYIDLPMDIMTTETSQPPVYPPKFSKQGPADPSCIKEASALINKAKNPVVVLGMLASRSANYNAIQNFIGKGNLPVVGTFQAAGAIGGSLFDHFGGRIGQINNQLGDRLLDSADLVVTIGYDPVEYWPPEWNYGKDRKIIHIDVLPCVLDTYYQPYVELIGDISNTLDALSSNISYRSDISLESLGVLKLIKSDMEFVKSEALKKNGNPIHPLRIIYELQKFLSNDVTVCLDMGSFHLWIARHLYSFKPRQILISNGQQTLGVALPWGIAASLVYPTEKVLSISGDGGFLFSSMEIETAVRLKSNLVHMVWDDGSYDMVKIQELIKYNRRSGVDLGKIDYVKYAEAFGAKGFMIRNPEEILPTLKKAFEIHGPVIIGVMVDYSDNKKLFENVNEISMH